MPGQIAHAFAAQVKAASGIGSSRNAPTLGKVGGSGPASRTNPLTPAAAPAALGNGASQAAAFPWDSAAQGHFAQAQQQHSVTNAQIASNRALGLSEYGLDAGYNDAKANPYSQAALLQHSHESNERGTLTTAGQALYSGQTGNAQSIESNRFSQNHQGLVNEQERAKAGWAGEEQAAKQAEENAYWEAREGALGRSNEEAPEPVPLPGGASGGKKVVKKKSAAGASRNAPKLRL